MLVTRRTVLKSSAALSAAALFPEGALSAVSDRLNPDLQHLQQDAESAWQFFQQSGDLAPGIVAVTAWIEGESIGNFPVLTMWDVGSLILGYVSATYLGLLSETDLRSRITGVIDFLSKATFPYQGAHLLNYRNNTKDASSFEPGFDSTDTGRLLIALKVLDRFTQESFGIEKLIAGWSIEKTIVDGKMHDIKGGKLEPATSFLYANYVSRGYDLWGIAHDPVLPDRRPLRSQGARQDFLKLVREVGAVATEPSVTEAVELGVSEPGQVIADLLFEAQTKRYEATGILTCVSEGPMDRDPWFTYQGYELGEGEGEGSWTVYTIDPAPEWNTTEFMDAARMVSSKGAFLWLAFRPDTYCDLLHQHVVQNGQSERLGFAAGIYEKTGLMTNVFDLNTNAAVLESIAYIANGRKPLIDLT